MARSDERDQLFAFRERRKNCVHARPADQAIATDQKVTGLLQGSPPFGVIFARHLEAVRFGEHLQRVAGRIFNVRPSKNIGRFALRALVDIGRSDDLRYAVSPLNRAVRGGNTGETEWKMSKVLPRPLRACDDNTDERDSALA